MKKYIFLFLSFIFLLSGCGGKDEVIEKQDFSQDPLVAGVISKGNHLSERTIDISGNKLEKIPELFIYIPNRKDQVMYNKFLAKGSSIKSISPQAFSLFDTMVYVDLSENDISEITLMDGQLAEIHLQRNKIKSLNFQELKSLNNIFLSSNEISDLSNCKFAPNTLKLDLSKNKIEDVSALSSLPLLNYLDLSGNPIDSKDLEDIKKIPSLRTIVLEETSISLEEKKEMQKYLDTRGEKE